MDENEYVTLKELLKLNKDGTIHSVTRFIETKHGDKPWDFRIGNDYYYVYGQYSHLEEE